MKKLTAFFLAVCLLFTLSACTGSAAPTVTDAPSTESSYVTPPTESASGITPLLYKATDDSGNTVWLFGSIHVGREDFYPLPDYVTSAYQTSEALAVECDVIAAEKDLAGQMQLLQTMVYTDGTTIRDHIPTDLYDRAVALLDENHMYYAALDYYCPMLWATFIESISYELGGTDPQLGIDMHLLRQAYEEEKPILEIESVELQYNLMASFPAQLQCMLLESAVQSAETPILGQFAIKLLVQAWADGNETALQMLTRTDTSLATPEEQQLYAFYDDAMITQRNIAMTDFAEEALSSGQQVFICVGAAHIIGEGGMAALLAQRGYTVETVN